MASYVHPRCATVLTANYIAPALPRRFSVLASPTGRGIAMSIVRSLIRWSISATYLVKVTNSTPKPPGLGRGETLLNKGPFYQGRREKNHGKAFEFISANQFSSLSSSGLSPLLESR